MNKSVNITKNSSKNITLNMANSSNLSSLLPTFQVLPPACDRNPTEAMCCPCQCAEEEDADVLKDLSDFIGIKKEKPKSKKEKKKAKIEKKCNKLKRKVEKEPEAKVETDCSLTSRPTVSDFGYEDQWAGWYDVQDCGECNDYCRWTGQSGSGGDPSLKVVFNDSFWSCTMGTSHKNTLRNHWGIFTWQRCTGSKEPIEILAATGEKLRTVSAACGGKAAVSVEKMGFEDEFRGWYDVSGCGECNDYCRWTGSSGSGGSPKHHTVFEGSAWVCLLGASGRSSSKGQWPVFGLRKC